MHQSFHKDAINCVRSYIKENFSEEISLNICTTCFSVLASLAGLGTKYIIEYEVTTHTFSQWDILLCGAAILFSYVSIGSLFLIRNINKELRALKNKIPQARINKI